MVFPVGFPMAFIPQENNRSGSLIFDLPSLVVDDFPSVDTVDTFSKPLSIPEDQDRIFGLESGRIFI